MTNEEAYYDQSGKDLPELVYEVLKLREHNFELQQRHIQYVIELQKATAKINKLESQIDLAVEALEEIKKMDWCYECNAEGEAKIALEKINGTKKKKEHQRLDTSYEDYEVMRKDNEWKD